MVISFGLLGREHWVGMSQQSTVRELSPGSVEPTSSRCSHSSEMFHELRRRCAAYEQSLVRLISADFIAEANFYFG
jgi:hypothetical protein